MPNVRASFAPYSDWIGVNRNRFAVSRCATKRTQREQKMQTPSNRITSSSGHFGISDYPAQKRDQHEHNGRSCLYQRAERLDPEIGRQDRCAEHIAE